MAEVIGSLEHEGGFTNPRVAADEYKLDATHTSIIFKIKHLQYSYTFGRFNQVEGSFSTGDNPSFNFIVKTASIDTNNKKRDDHLRGPDFFSAKEFSEITFKSTDVHAHGDTLHVVGDLTLHGKTKSIEFHMKHHGQGKDPWGKYRTGYSTDFTVKRGDFDMTNMPDAVGDEVALMISFEGIKQ